MTLPTVNARTMKLLLQHLYTGQSTFPQDDLNTWIDVSVTKYRTNGVLYHVTKNRYTILLHIISLMFTFTCI